MAQIPELNETLTLGEDDEVAMRQGTSDKRFKLKLASVITWAAKEGFTFVGAHQGGSQFTSPLQFTLSDGELFFAKQGTSFPYISLEDNPRLDSSLYRKSEEITAGARSQDTDDGKVIRSTNTSEELGSYLFIYNQEKQQLWGKPYQTPSNSVIISLSGDQLVTSTGTYTLHSLDPYNTVVGETSYTYVDDIVTRIEEDLIKGQKITEFTYDLGELVEATETYNNITRTTTYTYVGGVLTGVTTV